MERISGQKVEVAKPGIGVYICIGSIIKFATHGSLVWGTGAMRESDAPSRTARYYAVRGPLTRQVVKNVGAECPEIYGDPALLLPKYYSPSIEKKYRLGIIPHYVDYKAVKKRFPEHKVINLLNENPLEVVDEILSCEETVSSSLHGLIVSQAYGIPSALVDTIEGKLGGDGTKFEDYFYSTDQVSYKPISMETLSKVSPSCDIKFDANKLLKACPFAKGEYPKVVSFYTEDYLYHAKRLTGELDQLKLKHKIVKLDPIGDWIDNTRLKGRLVADELKYGPVLWLDADSSIHKLPMFFDGLEADFCAWPKPNPDRPWAVGHLWFNNTPKGIELAQAWARECENAPKGVSDEWALARAWKTVQGVKAIPLPRDYFAYDVNSDTVLSVRISGNASKYMTRNVRIRR
jgi:hypothetical protein